MTNPFGVQWRSEAKTPLWIGDGAAKWDQPPRVNRCAEPFQTFGSARLLSGFLALLSELTPHNL